MSDLGEIYNESVPNFQVTYLFRIASTKLGKLFLLKAEYEAAMSGFTQEDHSTSALAAILLRNLVAGQKVWVTARVCLSMSSDRGRHLQLNELYCKNRQ